MKTIEDKIANSVVKCLRDGGLEIVLRTILSHLEIPLKVNEPKTYDLLQRAYEEYTRRHDDEPLSPSLYSKENR
jgi:hypothetical protein